jgi:hypothetical protein
MSNSFVNKVSVERKIISAINTCTPGARQLTGLSSAAIEVWRRNAGTEATEEIVERLTALAELCQRLSDRSHETFQPVDSCLAENIEIGLTSLRRLVGVWDLHG